MGFPYVTQAGVRSVADEVFVKEVNEGKIILGGGFEELKTEADIIEACKLENVGKIYRFTGSNYSINILENLEGIETTNPDLLAAYLGGEGTHKIEKVNDKWYVVKPVYYYDFEGEHMTSDYYVRTYEKQLLPVEDFEYEFSFDIPELSGSVIVPKEKIEILHKDAGERSVNEVTFGVNLPYELEINSTSVTIEGVFNSGAWCFGSGFRFGGNAASSIAIRCANTSDSSKLYSINNLKIKVFKDRELYSENILNDYQEINLEQAGLKVSNDEVTSFTVEINKVQTNLNKNSLYKLDYKSKAGKTPIKEHDKITNIQFNVNYDEDDLCEKLGVKTSDELSDNDMSFKTLVSIAGEEDSNLTEDDIQIPDEVKGFFSTFGCSKLYFRVVLVNYDNQSQKVLIMDIPDGTPEDVMLGINCWPASPLDGGMITFVNPDKVELGDNFTITLDDLGNPKLNINKKRLTTSITVKTWKAHSSSIIFYTIQSDKNDYTGPSMTFSQGWISVPSIWLSRTLIESVENIPLFIKNHWQQDHINCTGEVAYTIGNDISNYIYTKASSEPEFIFEEVF